MNYIRHLNGFFEKAEDDENLTPYHISLYMSLFRQWNLNRFRNPFPVDREELMHLSRIGSRNTYARCMKHLHLWGYICYSPAGNFHTGRKVSCTRFDTGESTGSETRSDTGTGTRAGTRSESRTGTRSGTPNININNTNSINRNKQETIKNFLNERGKKVNGKSPHHVSTDKDYSEPL
jgi:hypothetical protein